MGRYEIDFLIVSVADGGKTTLENLQTLCEDCNLGKGRTSVR
jgi:5-methylcytosine-specific restriction endonuclease McrA